MICPVDSFIEALRLPFTAVVETTPSFADLPPKMLKTFPIMPPSEICVFSRVLTSAHAGPGINARRGSATAQEIIRRLIGPPEWVKLCPPVRHCNLTAPDEHESDGITILPSRSVC